MRIRESLCGFDGGIMTNCLGLWDILLANVVDFKWLRRLLELLDAHTESSAFAGSQNVSIRHKFIFVHSTPFLLFPGDVFSRCHLESLHVVDRDALALDRHVVQVKSRCNFDTSKAIVVGEKFIRKEFGQTWIGEGGHGI